MLLSIFLPLLFALQFGDASAFSSRHLIIQGCHDAGVSPFWVSMKESLVEGMASDGLAFDTVACPLNKVEERNAVAAVMDVHGGAASASSPILIVGALVQYSHCFVGDFGESACTRDGDFSTYAASFSAEPLVMHLWLEAAPDEEEYGLNRSTHGSVRFIPNNFDGGRKAGIEFCIRTESSSPQRIAAFYGPASASHSTARIEGFKDAIAGNCPRHRVVHEHHADWSYDKAKAKAKSLFLVDGTISSVVCANDLMVLGVIDAARESLPNGLMGLLFVGYDNTLVIKEVLAAGTVSITIDQLASLSNNGLVFSIRSAIEQLSSLELSAGEVMSTDRVMRHFGLSQPDIQSRVNPVVTNMDGYIRRMLMNSYDRQTRPFSHFLEDGSSCSAVSAPTVIDIQFYLTGLDGVSENERTVSFEGYLRLWWNDTRLKYDGLAPGLCLDKLSLNSDALWLPDIYFENSAENHLIFAKGSPQVAGELLEVYPSGEVYWSRLARLTLACDMDFRWLPFDTQACDFVVRTYSQDASVVQLRWKPEDTPMPNWEQTEESPWSLVSVDAAERVEDFTSGRWSTAQLSMTLKRDPASLQMDIVLATMCVAFVYFGFWVTAWDATALHIVIILILVTQRDTVRSRLPSGAGATWLDDFLWGCISFVCVALVIKCLVYIAEHLMAQSETEEKSGGVKLIRTWRLVALLDYPMRFVFPLVFMLFFQSMFFIVPGTTGVGDVAVLVILAVLVAIAIMATVVAAHRTMHRREEATNNVSSEEVVGNQGVNGVQC